MEDLYFRDGKYGLAKWRPGYLSVFPRGLNTPYERANYRSDLSFLDYPYISDELKYLDTFEWSNFNFLSEASRSRIRLDRDHIVSLWKDNYGEPWEEKVVSYADERFEFPINKLMHATTRANLESITRGGKIFFNVRDTKYNCDMANNQAVLNRWPWKSTDVSLLWTTALLDDSRDEYLDYLMRRAYLMDEWRAINIGKNTIPFHPASYCCKSKPFGFVSHPTSADTWAISFQFNEMLARYAWAIGSRQLQATRLGTEIYKAEHMYTVLIHPPIGHKSLSWKDTNFIHFLGPRMGEVPSENDEAILYRIHENKLGIPDKSIIFDGEPNGDFFCKPLSTSSDFSFGETTRYGRWDNPTFAFLLPGAMKNKEGPGPQGFDFSGMGSEKFELMRSS